jgi:hypothetical protein
MGVCADPIYISSGTRTDPELDTSLGATNGGNILVQSSGGGTTDVTVGGNTGESGNVKAHSGGSYDGYVYVQAREPSSKTTMTVHGKVEADEYISVGSKEGIAELHVKKGVQAGTSIEVWGIDGTARLDVNGDVKAGGSIVVWGSDGGTASLDVNGDVKAGDAIQVQGSNGGTTSLDVNGDVEASSILLVHRFSANSNSVRFTAKTVTTGKISLDKENGDLQFEIETLDVTTGSTTLELTGTSAGDVTIETVELGAQPLTVTSFGGDYTITDLKVVEPGAIFVGTLDTVANTGVQHITFDLKSVGVGNILLEVAGTANIDLSKLSLIYTGAGSIKLSANEEITFFKGSGSTPLTITGLGWVDGKSLITTIDGFEFELWDDGSNNLIGRFIAFIPPDGGNPIIVPANRRDDHNQLCTDNPLILSISENQLQAGQLTIDAWSGEGCTHSFQWQKQEKNIWKNIPGANKETYDYHKLGPGTHLLRCIVRNSTGGEAISKEVTGTIPQ